MSRNDLKGPSAGADRPALMMAGRYYTKGVVYLMSASYAKLRGRIKEKFGSQDNFAAAMDMDRSTLSLKLNGKSDWTRQEIEKGCILLHIPVVEVHVYFFTP